MLDLKEVNIRGFKEIETILDSFDIDHEVFGDNIYCRCPIHEGSDNDRGFSISTDKLLWKCWTRGCESVYGGDIFGLVRGVLSSQLVEEASFGDALKYMCSTLGIKGDNKKSPKREKPDEFVELVSMFTKLSGSQGPKAIEIKKYDLQPSKYFESRGFSSETLKHFGVGDCHSRNSDMYQRAVIPIRTPAGDLFAYLGRSIKDYIKPKFLFTSGFDKRFFLYNLDLAAHRARETSALIITEGQGDVWRLFENGVSNAVGIFGKTITKQQENEMLKNGITKLVILTDNDQAGRESKIQIQRSLSRNFTLIFPRFSGKDIGDMNKGQVMNVLSQIKGLY
jgi:DNA primase